jgi:hypothetical protein
MAKRKDLSNKLSTKTTKKDAPGWRDMIPHAEDEDATKKKSATKRSSKVADDKKVRKTYYLRNATISRIQELADQERVGISDFVEYALTRFLDMMDEGEIEMETKVKEIREIIY